MRVPLSLVLFLLQTATPPEPNSPPSDAQPSRVRDLQRKAGQLLSASRQFKDWDQQFAYMLDSTERVFSRSGWDSEPDMFAMEMIRAVGSKPPWAVQERMDAFFDALEGRYDLDQEQRQTLKQIMFQKSIGVFARHSDAILEYATDAIQTRAAGRPFTPEQIARWARLAEPVIEDARQTLIEGAEEFMDVLDPRQREIVQRDLEADNRRYRDVVEMLPRWKSGQWDPSDWGLEEDPIQSGEAQDTKHANAATEQERASDAGGEPEMPVERPAAQPVTGAPDGPMPPAASPPSPKPKERPSAARVEDNDEWARYVRDFIRRYDLNEDQQQKAWLYHDGLRQRRDAIEKRTTEGQPAAADKPPASATRPGRRRADATTGGSHSNLSESQQKDIERLFEQLKLRLERLPTRAQRKAVDDAPPTASQPARKP